MRLPVVISAITLVGFLAATGPVALASTSAESEEVPSACQRVTSGVEEVSPSEPLGIGAGIVLDEHLLTNGKRDEDYNGRRSHLLGRARRPDRARVRSDTRLHR